MFNIYNCCCKAPHTKFLHCFDPHGLPVNGYQDVIIGALLLLLCGSHPPHPTPSTALQPMLST
jgi:hypothetical protein